MDVHIHLLWDAYRQLRDDATRVRLVEHYMPLARVIAAKLYSMRFDRASSFDDYLQYARVGLIEAVDRFDASRNTSFETFSSYRIRGAILNGVRQSSEAAAQSSFWRSRTTDRVTSLTEGLHRDAAQATLAELIDFTVELAIGFVLEDNAGELSDEAAGSNPYAAAELAQLAHRLRELIGQLPEREKAVIEGHYYDHQEFQFLAESFGVTKGRVSQLHARALSRLRELLQEQPRLDRKV